MTAEPSVETVLFVPPAQLNGFCIQSRGVLKRVEVVGGRLGGPADGRPDSAGRQPDEWLVVAQVPIARELV